MKIIYTLFCLLFLTTIAFSQEEIVGIWKIDETKMIVLNKDHSFEHVSEDRVYKGQYKTILNGNIFKLSLMYEQGGTKEYDLKIVNANKTILINPVTKAEIELKRSVQNTTTVVNSDSKIPIKKPEIENNSLENNSPPENRIGNTKPFESSSDNYSDYEANEKDNFRLNSDILKTIQPKIGLGFSANFSRGSYINYHKSFHKVTEDNSIIEGKINPNLFCNLTVELELQPFEGQYFKNIRLRPGIHYYQRGFKNIFKSKHSSPLNFEDITHYSETYKLNYIGINLRASYSLSRWYLSAGISRDIFINGTKSESIYREQSGPEAIEGGFSLKDKQKYKIPKESIKNNTNLLLGIGLTINEQYIIELGGGLEGNVFKVVEEDFLGSSARITLYKNINL